MCSDCNVHMISTKHWDAVQTRNLRCREKESRGSSQHVVGGKNTFRGFQGQANGRFSIALYLAGRSTTYKMAEGWGRELASCKTLKTFSLGSPLGLLSGVSWGVAGKVSLHHNGCMSLCIDVRATSRAVGHFGALEQPDKGVSSMQAKWQLNNQRS